MIAEGRADYVRDRPVDAIRVPHPGRTLAHYITALSAGIEGMIAELRVPSGGRVLDFGCADQPYWHLFPADVEVVGADLPGNPLATVHLDEDGSIPVPDASFDAVLSTQVLEHVSDPQRYLSECHRALRPGGRLLLSTHGIFYLHPDPVDYWRWTSPGLQKAIEDAGLRVTQLEGIFSAGAVGLQFTLDAMLPRLPPRLRPLACRLFHPIIAFVDGRQSAEAKRLNASVYVVVAERPLTP